MAKKKPQTSVKKTAQKKSQSSQRTPKTFKVTNKKKFAVQGGTPLEEVTAMIAERAKLGKKLVLHVGCGDKEKGSGLHPHFKAGEWEEIRLDIEPSVKPDIVSDIRDLAGIADMSVDAIWSSHNIEHVYPHQVQQTLNEFYRVLKVGGFMLIATPDIYEVCEAVVKKGIDSTLYVSPSGPITPIDVMYGHVASLEQGAYFMAHKTGFTAHSLGQKMFGVGCRNIRIHRDMFNLTAIGYRLPEGEGDQRINIRGKDVNDMMRQRDELDQEPETQWEGLGFNE